MTMKKKPSEEIIIAIATALLFNNQEGLSPLGKISYSKRKDLLNFKDEFFLDEEESDV